MMHRTWVEISLESIAANYHALRRAAGVGVLVAPVVKADAYRHGAVQVARRLEAEGASWLAVSNSAEGVQLRDAGIGARILVMGGFLDCEREALAVFSLTPVIHSLATLRELNRYAVSRSAVLPVHLKIDTGMGRLGSRATCEEMIQSVREASHLRLEGLMTHFASASDFTTSQTSDQISAFEAAHQAFIRAGIVPELVHLSSSAPLAFGLKCAFGTMVRPGLALYGYVSPPAGRAPQLLLQVEPALMWKARILEVKEIDVDMPVGYGARWRTARASRIGVIAAGYADGLPHTLSNRGHVIAGGRIVPLAGAVSMDLSSVDLTDAPEVQAGDAVTLIGKEDDARYDAEDMAREAGIISYAVLCGIGNRVARVYVE